MKNQNANYKAIKRFSIRRVLPFNPNLFLIGLIAGITFLQCTPPKESIKEESNFLDIPPGTVKVGNNVFFDDAEITNIDYLEFMYWTKHIYGSESSEYNKCQPFQKDELYECPSQKFDSSYFHNPAFSNYPAIGISHQQAITYSNWRTDRVAEIALIKSGNIKIDGYLHPNEHFTINRYIQGGYEWILKHEDITVPYYRLPSEEEWEAVAAKWIGVLNNMKELAKKGESEKVAKFLHVSNQKNELGPQSKKSRQALTDGPADLFGSLSEMVQTKGISKGGNWQTPISEIDVAKNESYTSTNCWTGFRNICRLKEFKVKNNID